VEPLNWVLLPAMIGTHTYHPIHPADELPLPYRLIIDSSIILQLKYYSLALSKIESTTFKSCEPENTNAKSCSKTNLPATTGDSESPIGIG